MTTTDSAATSLGYPQAELAARGAGHTAREIAQQPALWREALRPRRGGRRSTRSSRRCWRARTCASC